MPALKTLLSKYFTTDLSQADWKRTGLLIVVILAVAAALWQWFMPRVQTLTTTEFRRTTKIREVAKVETRTVPGPERLVILDKDTMARKLPLSPEVVATPAQQIAATADLPESKNGIQAVSVINTETGETRIEAREKEAPWFQFRNEGAIGIRYGLDQRLAYTGTAYGRWDFLRLRNIWVSANGSIETGGDARLQVGAEYRW